MSAHREQAHIDAPVEAVWSLVGAPRRYPEWWPRVIEVRGERFEQGDEYVQVTRDPGRNVKTNFLIEQARDLREIRMSCQLTGTYAHWLLTPAQGGTFVELDMGMEPKRFGDHLFDLTMGKWYFRSWSQKSLDALRNAARHEPALAPSSSQPSVGAGAGNERENEGADLHRRWHAEMVEAEAGDDPRHEDDDPGLA
jgi:uncharacterized protein YndB with AHSA1/START domain